MMAEETNTTDGSNVALLDLPSSETTKTAQMRKAADLTAEREMIRVWSNGLDWPVIVWIGLVHVGALAAPFYFTWVGLIAFALLSWMSGGLGVCLGYHRLLTHSSFQTYRWVRRAFGLMGTMAGEGPPATWVAVHRKHHRFSDQQGDPHSPHDGGWWSHILWLFPRPKDPQWQEMHTKYAKDLLKDPFFRMLDKTFLLWHIGLGALLFTLGWAIWDVRTGVSLLVWGLFLRMVYVLHITWLVNSASHMWGYRNYETTDDSRNLWWVGLLAFGEGWHNNHHAFPARAAHGHRWWEFDVTWIVIRAMEKVGLVWKVVRERPQDKNRYKT
jgi:stearoyl-CoA desaturase (delta-9 desaturase)